MPAEPADPLLSPMQRRIVGFALSMLAVLGSLALLVGTLIVLGRAIGFFSGVLWPLAIAAVLALILRPLVEIAERRLRLRRVLAVVLLYATGLLVLTGLLLAVIPPLIDQAINLVAALPALWDSSVNYVRQHFPQWMDLIQRQLDKLPGSATGPNGENTTLRDLSATLVEQLQTLINQAVPSLKAAGGGVLGVFVFFTNTAIIPVYLFFMLLARGEPTRQLPEHLVFLSPRVRDDVVFLVREFVSIVVAFFRGQLIIGLIMGALLATGFTIIGLRFGLILGLALGLLNIVPYLGTIVGLAITLPLAFFQPDGGWQLIALVLLVVVIVQLIEGWVLTPKIMGMQTGLHPVAIIVAVFFWGTAFGGVLGMLLAIPLTAFFVTAWRLVRWKYLTLPRTTEPPV